MDGACRAMTDKNPPFWLVWCPDGRAPVYRHPSYESARAEAERLATGNPNKIFYVLCPAARCVKESVRWEFFVNDPDKDDDIPF